VSVSESEDPTPDGGGASGDLAALATCASEAVRAGTGWALATVAGWLGWGAPVDPPGGRKEAPVALRALPGGATAQPRREAAVTSSREHGRRAPGHAQPVVPPAAPSATFEALQRDALTVLVRDPQALFVFWSLGRETAEERARLAAGMPGGVARDALRIEAEGDEAAGDAIAAAAWVALLAPGATSAHVDLLRPRRRVRVVLGLAGDGDLFVPLVSGEPVGLPFTSEAPLALPRWRRVGQPGAGGETPVAPSAESAALLAARAAESDAAPSSTAPAAHHVLALERGTGAGGSSS